MATPKGLQKRVLFMATRIHLFRSFGWMPVRGSEGWFL